MTDNFGIQYSPYNMYGYNFPAFRGTTSPLNNYNSVPKLTSQPDTVSFSSSNQLQQPQKEGLSTGAKWGLGAVAVLGLSTLAYVLSRGKIGSSAVKQLAEHIEFKPAKTIEEAKSFAKDNLGVHIKFDDIDMANYVNEALTTLNNTTKGKSIMPHSIFVDKIGTNGNAFYAWRGSSNHPSDFVISPNAYMLGSIAKSKNMTVKELYTNALLKDNRFKDKGLSPFKEIFHELGHGNHEAVCKDYSKMGTLKQLEARDIGDKHFTEEFIAETKDNKAVKDFFESVGYAHKDGSIYALVSPAEFIAEIFSLKVQGKTIPEELQRLYKKYGGPSL